ncbi:hypothetical protein DRO66_11825 [Candidatus Bathyarchaeota archaeon]|nr:MAG: hypothetical protein DRO66_11825 [Candidatus Bathyarchaeota archaeon]
MDLVPITISLTLRDYLVFRHLSFGEQLRKQTKVCNYLPLWQDTILIYRVKTLQFVDCTNMKSKLI